MRLVSLIRFFALSIIICSMTALIAQQPTMMLANTAFVDQDKDGLPDGWRPYPAADNITTRLILAPQGPYVALRIVDTEMATGVGVAQWIGCQPGHRYTFSAETKGGPVSLYLNFCDDQRRVIGPEHYTTIPAGEKWRRWTVSDIAPDGTVQVQVRIYSTSINITDVLVAKPELRDEGTNVNTGPRTSDVDFFAAMNLDYPGMQAVKDAVAAGDLTAAKIAYLHYRQTRSAVRWDINWHPGKTAPPISDPAAKPATPFAAGDALGEQVLQHRFSMPSGADRAHYFVGVRINWNFNPRQPDDPGFTREWTYSQNRMYFWDTLGNAYWNTHDERFAREWIDQMQGWVRDNPVPLDAGPGDTLTWRSIEAGIRMGSTWPNAYCHFLRSPSMTADAHATFVKSVLEHAVRLQRVNTHYPDHGGNWVTMECNGLGTVGFLFPELKQSPEFIKSAVDRLNRELTAQVYPDGGQVELSTGYHQIARENFVGIVKLAKMNDVALPPEYLTRLKAMYAWNLALMDQSGCLPPFNDGGGNPRVADSLREAYQLWGGDEFLFGSTLGSKGKALAASSTLPYSGYNVMRGGWGANDLYLVFDNGSAGTGHWHEDMLNLYLRRFGTVLLTEAGGYPYDQSQWRRYVISTPAHNTITVDGKEQHRGGVEKMTTMAPVKAPWSSSPLYDYAAGTYDAGYQAQEYIAREYMPMRYIGKTDTAVAHTRHLLFFKPYYALVVDLLTGTGKHRYDAYFHLNAPDALVDEAGKSVRTRRTDGKQLALYPFDLDGLQVKTVIGQENPILGWVPERKSPIPTVVYTKQSAAPAVFSTLLFPYQGDHPQVSARMLPVNGQNFWGREIETPYEKVLVVIKRNPNATLERLVTGMVSINSTDAAMLVVRRPVKKAACWIGIEQATTYAATDLKWTSPVPVSLLYTRESSTGKLIFYNTGSKTINLTLSRPYRICLILPPGTWIQLTAKSATVMANPPAVTP